MWNNISIIALVLLITNGYAQQYRWKSELDSVKSEGFYNIVLTPDISSRLNDDFSDIRIKDANEKEIPYILKSEIPYFDQQLFKEYPIVEKTIIKNCCTKIIIRNASKTNINNISLVLKNSDAIKVARVLGSDDKKEWYGIKQSYVFQNSYSETSPTTTNVIGFPLSNYEYYMFEVSDYYSAPLNVLKAGYYDSYIMQGKYLPVPAPSLMQSDSMTIKKTYIKITFNENYFIDQLKFTFEGPRFYKRNAILADKQTLKNKQVYFEPITSLTIDSYSDNSMAIKDYFRKKEFYLIIDNEDNEPLKLKSVEAQQLTHYLKTYLKPGANYKLLYSNEKAVFPVYDLRFFADSIPAMLPDLNVLKNINITTNNTNEIKRAPKWFENKVWIWAAIGGVIMLLGFMSYKMVNEMKNKKSSMDDGQ
jgi:hypothetical protein